MDQDQAGGGKRKILHSRFQTAYRTFFGCELAKTMGCKAEWASSTDSSAPYAMQNCTIIRSQCSSDDDQMSTLQI